MADYSEDNLVMISALQHLLFCPRQCALIHVEQLWVENRLTAEGRVLHQRVHESGKVARRNLRIEYDLPIRSLRLGLVGRADVVEFHRREDGDWQPFPVEYKRGRPKKDNSDRVQLCAQALCLAEMLKIDVPRGALFYGKQHRRHEVCFDEELIALTVSTASQLHELIRSGHTPAPCYSKRCENCSFIDLCLPKSMGKKRRVQKYMERMLGAVTK